MRVDWKNSTESESWSTALMAVIHSGILSIVLSVSTMVFFPHAKSQLSSCSLGLKEWQPHVTFTFLIFCPLTKKKKKNLLWHSTVASLEISCWDDVSTGLKNSNKHQNRPRLASNLRNSCCFLNSLKMLRSIFPL